MDDPDRLIAKKSLRDTRPDDRDVWGIPALRASQIEQSEPPSFEASELARFREANARLRARVRELETQLASGHVLSEDQLLAELPGRTAGVLESAIDAANDITTRAKESSRRLEQEARDRADGLLRRVDERATALSRQAGHRAQELIRTAEDRQRQMLARIDEQRRALEDDLAAQRAAVEAEVAEARGQLLGLRQAHDDAVQIIEAAMRRLGTASRRTGSAARGVMADTTSGDTVGPLPVHAVPEEAVESVARWQSEFTADADARTLETPIDVLFVCTHNLFRSPVAAKLLSNRVAELSIPVRVRSAGMESARHGMPSALKALLKKHDIDIHRHRCRLLSPQTLETADLVLAMSRDHVLEIQRNVPTHWRRTFTLKELVRLGEQIGSRGGGESVTQWLDRVNAERGEPAERSGRDDLLDPNGQSRLYYQQLLEELESLIDRLIALLWQEDTQWDRKAGQTIGRRLGENYRHRASSLSRLWDRGSSASPPHSSTDQGGRLKRPTSGAGIPGSRQIGNRPRPQEGETLT